MNKLGMWAGIFAVWGALILTGCGGDDDDEGGRPFFAPIGLMGRTYNLIGQGGPTSITFADSGNTYAVTNPDAQVSPVGSYAASRNGNIWTVRITSADARFTSELVLNFNGPGRGSYRFTEPGWVQSVLGAFEETGFSGNPNPGGTTTGGTPGGGTGTPVASPASLSQITLRENPGSPMGRTNSVTINFAGGIFSTGTRSGNFTYRRLPGGNGSTAQLQLNYSGGPTPDFEDYTLTFFEGNTGSYNGVQRFGLVQGPATGTFAYVAP